MDLRPSIFPTQGFEIKNAHFTTEGFKIFMSKFSTDGFEISNFLPQIFSPKHKKSHEAKFQILFMEKNQKNQKVKFENFTHGNLFQKCQGVTFANSVRGKYSKVSGNQI